MMEEPDVRQISPDSSSGSRHSSRESVGSASSSGLNCPQCPSVFRNDRSLAAHLLADHRMRFVVANDPPLVMHAQPQQLLNSTASSVSTSPVMPEEAEDSSPPSSRASINGSAAAAAA